MDNSKNITASLLSDLFSENKAKRAQANKILDGFTFSNPNQVIQDMMVLLKGSEDIELKKNILIVFKDLLGQENPSKCIVKQVQPELFVKILDELIEYGEQTAKDSSLTGNLAETIASIGDSIQMCNEDANDEDINPQFTNIQGFNNKISQLLSKEDKKSIILGLGVMEELFITAYQDFWDREEELKNMFQKFYEKDDDEIKKAVIQAFFNYLVVSNFDKLPLKDLVMNGVQFIQECSDKHIEWLPDLLGPLNDFVSTYAQKLKSKKKDFWELFRSAASSSKVAGETLKHVVGFGFYYLRNFKFEAKEFNLVFESLLNLMEETVLEVDDDWKSPKDQETFEKTDDPKHTELFQQIHDLFDIDQTKAQAYCTKELIPSIQKTPNWRKKFTGIMVISQIGEYYPITQLKTLIEIVLSEVKNENPKVRHAAFHAIGQMADDQPEIFQFEFHDKVIPVLLEGLKDDCDRVLSHSMAAMTNFFEKAKPEIMKAHIDDFTKPILANIKEKPIFVKENAISALSNLGEIPGKLLLPYWEQIQAVLFKIMITETDPASEQLRSQTIECTTMMASGLGKEDFSKTVPFLLKQMHKIQVDLDVRKQSVLAEYTASGWGRLIAILEDDAAPYVNEIQGAIDLIDRLVEFVVKLDNGEIDTSELEKELNFNDGIVELAGSTVQSFLKFAPEACLPKLETICNVAANMMNDLGQEGSRVWGSSLIKNTVTAICKSQQEDSKKESQIQILLDKLLETFYTEYKVGLKKTLMSYFSRTIREIKDLELSKEFIERFVKTLQQEIVSSKQRIQESHDSLEQKKNLQNSNQNANNNNKEDDDNEDDFEDDYEDEDEEDDDDGDGDGQANPQQEIEDIKQELENEKALQSKLYESIFGLFSLNKVAGLKLSKDYYANYISKMRDSEDFNDIVALLYYIDDMIDNFGYEAFKELWEQFRQDIFKHISHEKSSICQASAYGIGTLAQHSPSGYYNSHVMQALGLLQQAYLKEKSNDDNWTSFEYFKDNVIASIAKIMEYQSEGIQDLKAVFEQWIKLLPLKRDKDESKTCYKLAFKIPLDKKAEILDQKIVGKLVEVGGKALTMEEKWIDDNVKEQAKLFVEQLRYDDEFGEVLIKEVNKLDSENPFRQLCPLED